MDPTVIVFDRSLTLSLKSGISIIYAAAEPLAIRYIPIRENANALTRVKVTESRLL
jgi:hypothetical protein